MFTARSKEAIDYRMPQKCWQFPQPFPPSHVLPFCLLHSLPMMSLLGEIDDVIGEIAM